MSRTFRRVKHATFWRHPKTMQEVKASEGMKVDGFHVRKKRTKTHLPNEYDDLPIAALKEIKGKKCPKGPNWA